MGLSSKTCVGLLALLSIALPCPLFAQSPEPSLADSVKVHKATPIVITVQHGGVEVRESETTDVEARACKERDVALEKMESADREYDAAYKKATTPRGQAAFSTSARQLDAAASAYYQAAERCYASRNASSGKSKPTKGQPSGAEQRTTGRSVFVDTVPSGSLNQNDAPRCRISSLRLCHDKCDGEYGSLCMWGQICDPDRHTCGKASP